MTKKTKSRPQTVCLTMRGLPIEIRDSLQQEAKRQLRSLSKQVSFVLAAWHEQQKEKEHAN
jgi:hypothetical protein